jgi:hypothetical protein
MRRVRMKMRLIHTNKGKKMCRGVEQLPERMFRVLM